MKKIVTFLLVLAGLYLLLLIPIQNTNEPQKASEIPFVWDQDTLWASLETNFLKAKGMSSKTLDSIVQAMAFEADSILNANTGVTNQPKDGFYVSIEQRFFQIAPLIAAQQNKSDWHIRFYNQVRKKIKHDSRFWDMNSADARNTAYRILYGIRATVEEILLQSTTD